MMELKPGFGKTYVALGLFLYFKVKAIFIVPAHLILQWKGEIEKWIPGLTIGLFMSGRKTDGDIILGSVQSLISSKKNSTAKTMYRGNVKVTMSNLEWWSQFGFTVIDEIHTYCTKLKSKIFRYCRSSRTLTMSGTCNHRLDKMNKISHMYFGKPINMFKVFPNLAEMVKMDVKVNAYQILYNGPDKFTEILSSVAGVSHPLMINQFTLDPWRNQLIINETLKCHFAGHATFILQAPELPNGPDFEIISFFSNSHLISGSNIVRFAVFPSSILLFSIPKIFLGLL